MKVQGELTDNRDNGGLQDEGILNAAELPGALHGGDLKRRQYEEVLKNYEKKGAPRQIMIENLKHEITKVTEGSLVRIQRNFYCCRAGIQLPGF